MSYSSERAKAFGALHAGPELLVLANAWDAASARVIAHAGAKAIATSSAAVAWAHGYPDGEAVPAEAVLQTIREVARTVDLPVSADIEAAYAVDAQTASAFVTKAMDAGAVGINIEDGLAPPDLLAAKIEHVRASVARGGRELWINARIDIYLRKIAQGDAAYKETVRRAKLYREAGANSIFVPAVVEDALLARLVPEVVLPFNALAFPGLPPAKRLAELGVRRLSAGSGIAKQALETTYALARAFLAEGRSETFAGGALPNVNELLKR